MGYIDCGQGYIFNPETGKCIKEGGVTAKKVEKKYGRVTQTGQCDGTVLTSASGIPYCTRSGSATLRSGSFGGGSGSGNSRGGSTTRVDARLVEAIRRLRAAMIRKNKKILELKKSTDSLKKTHDKEIFKFENELRACEKRMNSLISKSSK